MIRIINAHDILKGFFFGFSSADSYLLKDLSSKASSLEQNSNFNLRLF